MERGQSDQQESKASWTLFLAAFTALLGGLSMGTVLSWTSPAISSMQKEPVVASEISLIMSGSSPIQSDPNFFLGKDSTELISWIISIINIGGLIGSFIAGNICDWMGHRWFLFFSGLLSAGGWLFISLAINTNMVLVGRFITGFAIGCLSSSVNVYISEISTMKHRGWLGCCFSVFIVFGILGDSVAGLFVNWRMLSELCVIPPMLLSILILFFPESPHWLVKKDREHDALKSLKRLRANEDCTTELNLIVEQIRNARQATGDEDSLDTIIKSGVDSEGSLRSGGGGSNRIIVDSLVDMNRTNDNLSEDSAIKTEEDALKPEESKSSFLKDLKLPHVWKPLLFGLIIMAIQQLSGSNSLFGQLQDILDSSKIKQINQQQAAIIGEYAVSCSAKLLSTSRAKGHHRLHKSRNDNFTNFILFLEINLRIKSQCFLHHLRIFERLHCEPVRTSHTSCVLLIRLLDLASDDRQLLSG